MQHIFVYKSGVSWDEFKLFKWKLVYAANHAADAHNVECAFISHNQIKIPLQTLFKIRYYSASLASLKQKLHTKVS